jgi:hypothetical protein
MIRDKLASSKHQRAYMEDIHEQVWICAEGDGYIIWGKGIHSENVFAGGDIHTIFDDFIRINESGIQKIITCINFVTV